MKGLYLTKSHGYYFVHIYTYIQIRSREVNSLVKTEFEPEKQKKIHTLS